MIAWVISIVERSGVRITHDEGLGQPQKIVNPQDDFGKTMILPPSCAPLSARVDDFMHYFATRYRFVKLGKASWILAIPAAHYRNGSDHPDRFTKFIGPVARTK